MKRFGFANPSPNQQVIRMSPTGRQTHNPFLSFEVMKKERNNAMN